MYMGVNFLVLFYKKNSKKNQMLWIGSCAYLILFIYVELLFTYKETLWTDFSTKPNTHI